MPRVPPRMELEISRGRFCPGRSFGADLRSRLHSAGRIRGSPALEVEPDAPRSNVDCIKSRLATTASRPLRRQRLRRGAARPAWREGAAAGGEPRGPAHAPAQRREIAWRPGELPRYVPRASRGCYPWARAPAAGDDELDVDKAREGRREAQQSLEFKARVQCFLHELGELFPRPGGVPFFS